MRPKSLAKNPSSSKRARGAARSSASPSIGARRPRQPSSADAHGTSAKRPEVALPGEQRPVHRRGILRRRVLAAEEHAAAVLRPREGVVVVGRARGRQGRVGAARELVPRPLGPKHSRQCRAASDVPRAASSASQTNRRSVSSSSASAALDVATAHDRDEDVGRLRRAARRVEREEDFEAR